MRQLLGWPSRPDAGFSEHPETQHPLKEKLSHLPDAVPIHLCALAEKHLKQAHKVAQHSSCAKLTLGSERKDGICRQLSWNQWMHDVRPDVTLGTAWCLPSRTRWGIIIVLLTVIPFLQLILSSNYKHYPLSTLPASQVLRRKGYSLGYDQAIRKSIDFPALGEHDCGLGTLFVLTKYKYKPKEIEINYLQKFHQKFKEWITNHNINLFTNFKFPLNEPKFQWESFFILYLQRIYGTKRVVLPFIFQNTPSCQWTKVIETTKDLNASKTLREILNLINQ